MRPKGRGRSLDGRSSMVLAQVVWVIVLVLVAPLAACTTASPPTPATTTSATATRTKAGPGGLDLAAVPVGSSEHALTVGGQIRMYRVYRPAQLLSPPPVVVMLHGGLGTARQAETAYGWNPIADREGFLVVYPDALGGAWNAGNGCCGLAPAMGVDDVDFIATALADLAKDITVDPTRVYATGMSSGGLMAYRLACDTTIFAAIAPVSATLVGDCTNPAPLSVMHVHGTADTTIPYAARPDPAAPVATATPGVPASTPPPAGLATIDGKSIPDLMQIWRNVDRCGGTISRTDGPITTETAQCALGKTVTLVVVEGGGHEWPGVRHTGPLDATAGPAAGLGTTRISTAPSPSAGASGGAAAGGATSGTGATTGTGAPSGAGATAGTAYAATAAIWAFFAAHVR